MLDFVFEASLFRLGGLLKTSTQSIELPAVIGTTDALLIYPTEG